MLADKLEHMTDRGDRVFSIKAQTVPARKSLGQDDGN